VETTFPPTSIAYPAGIEGRVDAPSRWLWLVKWLLILPHLVVLVALWVALAATSIAAFVVMLFGGSYPRGIFEFNLGVLRWTWRVMFYAYSAGATDRYPPFTLQDVPDYPAHLDVAYPESQRHGLPLIGWWLAGIPQYALAGIFVGSTAGGGGVVCVLVAVALIMLLVRGDYSGSLFDVIMGFNRWAFRVVTYAAMMRPEYPPFRLDTGEPDPGFAAYRKEQGA